MVRRGVDMLPYFSKIWEKVTDRRLLIFLYIFHLLYIRDIAIDIFSSEHALAIYYKFGWFLAFYAAFDMLVELFSGKLIIKKQQITIWFFLDGLLSAHSSIRMVFPRKVRGSWHYF